MGTIYTALLWVAFAIALTCGAPALFIITTLLRLLALRCSKVRRLLYFLEVENERNLIPGCDDAEVASVILVGFPLGLITGITVIYLDSEALVVALFLICAVCALALKFIPDWDEMYQREIE